mmetsp:Transcript_57250/g.147234  ORF Transcript_57250/g.147234 Transcript_57250/m.147234 type:complete len:211 (-) Transcript_57250:27-659(-)
MPCAMRADASTHAGSASLHPLHASRPSSVRKERDRVELRRDQVPRPGTSLLLLVAGLASIAGVAALRRAAAAIQAAGAEVCAVRLHGSHHALGSLDHVAPVGVQNPPHQDEELGEVDLPLETHLLDVVRVLLFGFQLLGVLAQDGSDLAPEARQRVGVAVAQRADRRDHGTELNERDLRGAVGPPEEELAELVGLVVGEVGLLDGPPLLV